MTNRYLHQNRHRARGVDQLFTRIAKRYDFINDVQSLGLHRVWKRRMLKMAAIQSGDWVLDVCAGTGDLAIAAQRLGAKVVALDFNAAMLLQGKLRQEPLADKSATVASLDSGPTWIRGDALRLPISDAAFDRVVIAYGLRNLSDYSAGIQEMLRVLKPGGRLVVLDFGKPENRLWRGLYFSYLRWIVPVFGVCFCGDAQAYSYILESLRVYPGQQVVHSWMQAAGAVELRTIPILWGAMAINYCVKPMSKTESH